MPDEHAKYSPSSSNIWVNCPHAMTIIEKLPAGETNDAAEEGTKMHDEMERFLKNHTINFFNKKKKPSYEEFVKKLNTRKEALLKRGKLTHNLYKSMSGLYDLIEDEMGELPKKKTKGGDVLALPLLSFYEERLHMKTILKKDCWGTGDITFLTKHALFICDYKFGRIAVSPGSLQLRLYTVGAVRSLFKNFFKEFPEVDTIYNVIIQPRLHATPQYVAYSIPKFLKMEKEISRKASRNLLPKEKRKPVIGDWCYPYARCREFCTKWQRQNNRKINEAFASAGF